MQEYYCKGGKKKIDWGNQTSTTAFKSTREANVSRATSNILFSAGGDARRAEVDPTILM